MLDEQWTGWAEGHCRTPPEAGPVTSELSQEGLQTAARGKGSSASSLFPTLLLKGRPCLPICPSVLRLENVSWVTERNCCRGRPAL